MGERTHGDLDVLFSYMMDRCDWGRRLGSIAMRLDGWYGCGGEISQAQNIGCFLVVYCECGFGVNGEVRGLWVVDWGCKNWKGWCGENRFCCNTSKWVRWYRDGLGLGKMFLSGTVVWEVLLKQGYGEEKLCCGGNGGDCCGSGCDSGDSGGDCGGSCGVWCWRLRAESCFIILARWRWKCHERNLWTLKG